MKISLLLQREPFGELLEDTLGPYWSKELGVPVTVRWANPAAADQVWNGNIHLNFFCVPDVSPVCFDVIVREFGYARSPLRRGLQSAYVRAALTPPFRSWLSQVRFGVSISVPAANEKLVIGGNRRIRIIEPMRANSTVIHKSGYTRLPFDREVDARRGPASSIAPRLKAVDATELSFIEEYVVGTPANRMPMAKEKLVRQAATERLVTEVHRPTLSIRRLDEHLESLTEAGCALFPLWPEIISEFKCWGHKLGSAMKLGVCLSHGDFQDANILVQGERLYVIDWEAATMRSQLYDLATLESQVRLAPVPLEAWKRTVTKWLSQPATAPRLDVAPEGRAGWLAHAAVWWIEESLLRLEESRMAIRSADLGARDQKLLRDLRAAGEFLRGC